MKKSFFKILATLMVSVMAFAFVGCTYYKNGSEIQDVTFNISYTTADGEQTIESTMSIYKTFAPDTADRILNLIKDGFYNDTAITLSKQQDYAVIGGFNADYSVKQYSNSSILRGEFTENGWKSRLTVKPGALVMLRDLDSGLGESSKYDSAQAKFAIVLNATTVLNKDYYCVFGYIDDNSITALQNAIQANSTDTEGYARLRYVGDRNDKDIQTYEGAFEYYINSSSNLYKLVDGEKVAMEFATESDADYELNKKITAEFASQDIFVLPNTVFTVKGFKLS